MTDSHVAALWIAHCRLIASANRNMQESGDPEGDDEWATLLLELKYAFEDAPADPEEAVRAVIEPQLPIDVDHPHVVARAVLAALGFAGEATP